jgi:F0F1-type ATP synthase assembly protein I
MSDTTKLVFGAVLGALYVVIGLFQIIGAVIGPLPGFDAFYLTGNLFSGFVLLVVGAVFIAGVRKLAAGAGEGAIFVSVGVLLSVAFGLVELLALCAMGVDAYLVGEWADWSAADSMNPLLYLAVIGAVGFLAWGRTFLRGLSAA